MGTHGLKRTKCRGTYWTILYTKDGYPDGLGDEIVNTIPSNPTEYHEWLTRQRDYFAERHSLLKRSLCVKPGQLVGLGDNDFVLDILNDESDKIFEVPTSYKPFSAEYNYEIDLDEETFSYNDEVHYHLNKIPQRGQWYEGLVYDSADRICIDPKSIAGKSLACLTVDNDFISDATSYWDSLQRRVVTPKQCSWASSKFRAKIFDMFRKSEIGTLSTTLLGWTTKDLPFREISYLVLCLAAGGQYCTLMDDRCVIEPYKGSDTPGDGSAAGFMARSEPETGRELISALAVGYHMEDLPVGSSPPESKYWFLGALISLVPRLNCFDVLENAAADAVQYGFSKRDCRSLHILLISIEHVVLVEARKNAERISIDHTELLPLLAPHCHLSKDIWERYNSVHKVFTQNFYWKSNVGITGYQTNKDFNSAASSPESRKIAATDKLHDQSEKRGSEESQLGQRKRMRSEQHSEAQDSDNRDSAEQDDERDDDQKEERFANVARETFLALIRFLEASRGLQKGSYPTEIYKGILDEAPDTQTYSACLEASSSLRSLSHEQSNPSLGDLLFFEPISDTIKSDEMSKDGSTPAVPKPEDTNLNLPSGSVGIRAMRHSSTQQEDLIDQAPSRYQSAEFRMIVGHERNRRSFLAGFKIVIPYLDVVTYRWKPGMRRRS